MMELPKKELLRIDEVANYFSVTERTIRMWIEHGHLEAKKMPGAASGTVRITRASAAACLVGKKVLSAE